MKRRRKRSTVQVILNDWKDVEATYDDLKRALRRFGIRLQMWDFGTDDHILSVSRRRVPKRVVARHLRFSLESLSHVEEIRWASPESR